MTTATILQPTSHHPAARASVYPTPAAPVSNMISSEPGKSGRAPGAADVKDLPFRQSLPSISNALKVAEPRQFQLPAPPSMQPTSSFTSPFTSGHRGSYPDGDKHGSPHTIHHSFPPRQELSNAYADSPRSSFHGRPGLPAVPDRRPSPPLRPDLPPHHLTEAQRAQDPHHPLNNGAYAHPPPPAPPHPAGPYAHGPLHPGQVPLPGHPISPHRAGPPGPHPYDPSGPPSPHPDDANRARYDTGRHFETWEYPTALARVAQSARTVFNFAEAYHRIASEQSRSPLMPERLTTDHEIAEMLSRTDLVKRSLEQVREHVHQCAQSERIRDSAKQPKDPYDDDDDDVAMYSEHMKAPQYTMRETKKRRGRAAPPPGDVTAVRESIRPNGGEVQMVHGLSATPAVFITPNWKRNDNLRRARSDPSTTKDHDRSLRWINHFPTGSCLVSSTVSGAETHFGMRPYGCSHATRSKQIPTTGMHDSLS